ncbi:MAG: YedE-related selenium metabolism membrane protein [Deltaproteobacteria bacterium]|jgi:YedE family putative selenium metabolism protein|nr:YedE-related selenium metabolism membrane protein [Deltaproteobacteria bacterium]
MIQGKNVFASTGGIVLVGLVIGLIASMLQHFGNPGNMGICVACFERDIAGAIGLHRAAIVQYLRPEIIGLVLGAFAASIIFGDFRPRGGSAPVQRFILGMLAVIGALVFLGCPWRALLRLAGGDWNAIVGLVGLGCGIFVGTLFLRNGFSLGSSSRQNAFTGYIFPLVMVGLLILYLMFPQAEGQPQSGVLFYSVSGPGSMHAPLLLSLGCGLLIGFLAQRSRFCTMGALRDLFLFRQLHLMFGVVALVAAAFAANLYFGQFNPGFLNQPVAHNDWLWNFSGMLMAGLAFALAGGCPGRQLFMSGEGDSDAAIFALGMIAGAAVSHNFGLASSGAGAGPNGPLAVGIGLAILLVIGFANRQKA